jgi:hypothetical protein
MFYGTYIGGIFLAFTRAPIYAFLVYQAVYFFHPEKRWWGNSIPHLSYSYYSVIIMFVLVVLNWNKIKENKLFEVPQTKWIYLYLLLHFVAYLYAVSPIKHDIFTIYFLKLIIIISIAYKLISSKRDLYLAILGYVASAWYLSFYTFQIGRNRGDRVEGIGTVDAPESNGIAAALAPAIVFGIYFLWRSPNWKYKLLSLITLAFLCNSLILINSRGAVLGIICGAAFFMYDLYKGKLKGKHQKATVIALCLIGLSGVIAVADSTFIDRFSTLEKESSGINTQGESGSTRVIYWKAAYKLALDHPFGTGAFGFNKYAIIYIPDNTFVGQQLRANNGIKSVHSAWFSTLAELGFIGLFVFIMIIYSCFMSARKIKLYLYKEKNINDYYLVSAIQGALLTFAVTMTFLDRHRAEILYWLILFFMAAHNVFYNKSISGTNKNKVKEAISK